MYKYLVEQWKDVARDFDVLGQKNFDECHIGEGKVEYDLDHEFLSKLSDAGLLHFTSCRDDGRLVGYILTVLMPRHLQYKVFCAQHIAVYMLPEYRKKLNGYHMLKFNEESLKKLGVKRIYGGYTAAKDISALFRRAGWTETETICAKWI